MSKFVLSVAALAASLAIGQTAQAAPWIFQRSYYSHDPVVEVKIGPDRYQFDGPYFTRPQGEFIRSGFRQIQTNTGVPGPNYDNSIFFESWIQGGVQF
jgi:hypothetical protein